ncbi:hypothetical protein CB1_000843031 [Camelus ferus]|nr:hypothetical protein CB1_000843031 [Camelus ferus]
MVLTLVSASGESSEDSPDSLRSSPGAPSLILRYIWFYQTGVSTPDVASELLLYNPCPKLTISGTNLTHSQENWLCNLMLEIVHGESKMIALQSSCGSIPDTVVLGLVFGGYRGEEETPGDPTDHTTMGHCFV